jgi:hypothetical protein
MKSERRNFLKQSGLATAALTAVPGIALFAHTISFNGSEQVLKQLTEINDAAIEDLLTQQLSAPGDWWDIF